MASLPPPLLEPFSAPQLAVLAALGDAAFQAHTPGEVDEILALVPPDASDEQRANVRYLAETSFSQLPLAIEHFADRFALSLSPAALADIRVLLTLLSTTAGTLVLCGHARPFLELSVAERECVLQAWSTSSIILLRKAFRGMCSIALFIAYTHNERVALATGYPARGDPLRNVDAHRLRPAYPFRFETLAAPFQVVDTDVLVIGSGADGGVAAAALSKAWRTVVVEKGAYVPPAQLDGTPANGLRTLYENGGLLANEEGSMNIMAGSTWGGGTTVNWAASLRPQHFLREAWAARGLPHFLSAEFQASIDAVCSRMGVSDAHLAHSRPNELLVQGARKIGYHVDRIPQNTAGRAHACGFCSFGCPYNEKQGGTATWLVDAAQNGAQFYERTNVERLLFAANAAAPPPTEATLAQYTPSSSRRRCIGALVSDQHGVKAIIRAREAVVVSAGSINSPAVLLRSGLKGPRIGQNLHLHCVSYITGYFKEKIEPYSGAIMTAVSNVVENVDGEHYGCKLEVNMSFPGGTAAGFQPWTSSLAHKKALVQYDHAFTLLAISRDRDGGRVVIDRTGAPRVHYTISQHDAASVLSGVVAGGEILLAAGATRIVTTQAGVPDFYPPSNCDLATPAFREWVALVRAAGIKPTRAGLGSAHQMSSNSMGTSPANSAVDPRGRVWGTEGLYVADASVFPTASGVNPMITTMSVAHSIARWVDEDLHLAAQKLARAAL